MIDFKEIEQDGELWELFTETFCSKLVIMSKPQSIVVLMEKRFNCFGTSKRNLGNYKFKWLVSCKHFANRANGNSVKESDEPNILEAVESFNCDGFIGFYSTIASSGFNTELTQLKNNQKIKDYIIFDHKLIENYLIRIGYSNLLMRYFAESYKNIKPLHLITDSYIQLNCKTCGIDILQQMYKNQYHANYVQVHSFGHNGSEHIHDVFFSL